MSPNELDFAKRLLSLLLNGNCTIVIEPPRAETTTRKGPLFDQLQRRAAAILANRRRRSEIFGKAMFGEPAWEMLLMLYVFEAGRRYTISGLADASGASKSTALRWLDYLEGQRLVRRESHPTDRRAAFVELTDKGREAIELFLADTRTQAA